MSDQPHLTQLPLCPRPSTPHPIAPLPLPRLCGAFRVSGHRKGTTSNPMHCPPPIPRTLAPLLTPNPHEPCTTNLHQTCSSWPWRPGLRRRRSACACLCRHAGQGRRPWRPVPLQTPPARTLGPRWCLSSPSEPHDHKAQALVTATSPPPFLRGPLRRRIHHAAGHHNEEGTAYLHGRRAWTGRSSRGSRARGCSGRRVTSSGPGTRP